MQQRSRWAKGHFQLFWSKSCPLFDRGLPVLHRLLACSSIWSYVTCAFTTPILILVPLISIWVGFFPIALNQWTATGITVYFCCTQFVKFYHNSLRHVRVLWFSDLANTILFFVFMKAVINTFIAAIIGKSISFKVTTKGKGRVAAALRQIWLHIIIFLVTFVTLILGLASVSSNTNLPLVLSLLWNFYNTVPFYLILHYAYIGRNNSLKWACWCGMTLMLIAGGLSIFLVWFLLPSSYNFPQALNLSLNFYDIARAGQILNNNNVPPPVYNVRGNTPNSINCNQLNARNVSSTCPAGLENTTGFLQMGGNLGNIIFTVPVAYTVAMLSWSINFNRKVYQNGNNGHSLSEYTYQQIQWGADYLMSTVQGQAGGNVQYVIDFIGNPYFELNNNWYRIDGPSNYYPNGFQFSAHTATQGIQIFADIAAGLAAASQSLTLSTSTTANVSNYQQMAITLYNVAKQNAQNNQNYQLQPTTNLIPTPDPSNQQSFQMKDAYQSGTQYDDMLWAAAWLASSVQQNGQYNNDFTQFTQNFQNEIQSSLNNYQYFNWDNLYFGALALQIGQSPQYEQSLVNNLITPWVCGQSASIKYSYLGRAWSSSAGALSDTMNVAFLTLVYASQGTMISSGQVRLGYRCFAQTQVRYLLGDNNAYTYLEYMPRKGKAFGYHTPNAVTYTFSRIAACALNLGCGNGGVPGNPDINPVYGGLVYGPQINANALYGNTQPGDNFNNIRTQNQYDTWTALEYNAGLTGTLAGIIDSNVNWPQCLQGYGIRNFRYKPECPK